MPEPAAAMPESTAISSATIPISPEPHRIPPEPHRIPPEAHSKVGFVARNSDCQACNNNCKPRNHYFRAPAIRINTISTHAARVSAFAAWVEMVMKVMARGTAIGLCISFVLTNSSYLYNIVA